MAEHIKTRKHAQHKMNPNSMANLEKHRFKKGEIHCPQGRPKSGLSITEALREVADLRVNETIDRSKLTYAQAAAFVHWRLAVKGDKQAFEFITNRLEGKPKESIDMTTKGEAIGTGHIAIPDSNFRDALVILGNAGVTTSPN